MSLSQKRSRVANAAKNHKSRPSEQTRAQLDQARRELAEQKIADFVQQAVSAAPELTIDQKVRLTALLRGAGATA